MHAGVGDRVEIRIRDNGTGSSGTITYGNNVTLAAPSVLNANNPGHAYLFTGPAGTGCGTVPGDEADRRADCEGGGRG